MRILYGVSGEGFGHSSRAREIIPFLLGGHRIMVITYGQAYDVLKGLDGIRILKIEGIELFFKKGKGLSLKRTFFYNLKKISKNVKNFKQIMKKVDRFRPDVCISDMEPIVPIIRHWKKLPLISLDNQHRLTHLTLNVPKKYMREYRIAKYAVERVISKADAYIVLSFVKGKIKKDKEKVYVMGPILRDSVLKLKGRRGEFVLVYLTKEDDRVLDVLKKINERFIVYGYNLDKKEGNLEFKRTGEGFLEDLRKARAVIASAGFTLISEALYLKKPYFAIPLKGQFEQTLNALFLKQSGMGDFSEEPTKKDIEEFLNDLKKYENNLKRYSVDPEQASKVIEKVVKSYERS